CLTMSNFSIILDTETLDTPPNHGVITEIAMLAFERSTFQVVDHLILFPQILPQLAAGRTVSADTIDFHTRCGSLPVSLGEHSLQDCMVHIMGFFARLDPDRVWMQGPDFDRPLLDHFFWQNGQKLPWKYNRSRDTRTIWDVAFPGTKPAPRPHHAFEDCEATLRDLQSSLKELNRLEAA
ncbi:MAG: hypothetical protein JWO82_4291, partial [Akkermansiaceae bacterium]|nr:hypothetical protein [Akkermansiaceae bacterium]